MTVALQAVNHVGLAFMKLQPGKDQHQGAQKQTMPQLLALLQPQTCIALRLKARKTASEADVDAALQAHSAEIKIMRGALQGEVGYSPAQHDDVWCVRYLLQHGKANSERAIAAAKFTLAHRRARRLDELRHVVTSRPREQWPGHAAIHPLLPLELLHPDAELGPCCLIRHGCGASEGRVSNLPGPLVQLTRAAVPQPGLYGSRLPRPGQACFRGGRGLPAARVCLGPRLHRPEPG